jgi:nucleoside-diphosphate-sugar epimerase
VIKKKLIICTGRNSSIIKYLKNTKQIKSNFNFLEFSSSLSLNLKKHNINFFLHFKFKTKIDNEDPKKYIDGHLKILKKTINYCKKKNLILIYPSSVVYFPSTKSHKEDDPLYLDNLYYYTKFLSEEIIKNQNNLNYIILRIFNIYGHGKNKHLDYIKKNLDKKKVVLNESSSLIRDYIHIEDFVNLLHNILIIKNKKILNKTYNVGSGKKTSLKKVANFLQRNFNVKIIFKNNSHFTPERKICYANIAKIKKNLNWKPRITISKFFYD